MKQKLKLDMQKIAKGLGAERVGDVRAGSGYFAAARLVADIQARFRTPPTGGRGTDPSWTEKRLVAFAPETLERLEAVARKVSSGGRVPVSPLQVAALLIQRATEELDDSEIERLTSRTSSA